MKATFFAALLESCGAFYPGLESLGRQLAYRIRVTIGARVQWIGVVIRACPGRPTNEDNQQPNSWIASGRLTRRYRRHARSSGLVVSSTSRLVYTLAIHGVESSNQSVRAHESRNHRPIRSVFFPPSPRSPFGLQPIRQLTCWRHCWSISQLIASTAGLVLSCRCC